MLFLVQVRLRTEVQCTKFDPTGARTHGLQIMTVQFMSLRRLLLPSYVDLCGLLYTFLFLFLFFYLFYLFIFFALLGSFVARKSQKGLVRIFTPLDHLICINPRWLLKNVENLIYLLVKSYFSDLKFDLGIMRHHESVTLQLHWRNISMTTKNQNSHQITKCRENFAVVET